jgi:gas vesicle protein
MDFAFGTLSGAAIAAMAYLYSAEKWKRERRHFLDYTRRLEGDLRYARRRNSEYTRDYYEPKDDADWWKQQ